MFSSDYKHVTKIELLSIAGSVVADPRTSATVNVASFYHSAPDNNEHRYFLLAQNAKCVALAPYQCRINEESRGKRSTTGLHLSTINRQLRCQVVVSRFCIKRRIYSVWLLGFVTS